MSGFGGYGGQQRRGGDSYGDDGQSHDIFVPASDCGKIIGRGGQRIRELQDQTHCGIKVSRDDEGDGTRRVELSGSSDAIAAAKDMIQSILEGGDDRGGRSSYGQQRGGGGGYGGGGGGGFGGGRDGGGQKETMRIDSSFVGRIIGKGGSRIRELQDETGCRINVSRDGGQGGQTDVELIGDSRCISRAREAIDEICTSY